MSYLNLHTDHIPHFLLQFKMVQSAFMTDMSQIDLCTVIDHAISSEAFHHFSNKFTGQVLETGLPVSITKGTLHNQCVQQLSVKVAVIILLVQTSIGSVKESFPVPLKQIIQSCFS